MNVIRFRPWSLFDELNRDTQRWSGMRTQSPAVETAWKPAVDVREESDRFVLSADLPGVDPKVIDISTHAGVLELQGSRENQSKVDAAGHNHTERAQGSFRRSFKLPDDADITSISASHKQGVLEIVVPKKSDAMPRRIRVTH